MRILYMKPTHDNQIKLNSIVSVTSTESELRVLAVLSRYEATPLDQTATISPHISASHLPTCMTTPTTRTCMD